MRTLWLAVLAGLSAISAAHAAITGDRVDVTILYPDRSTVLQDVGPGIVSTAVEYPMADVDTRIDFQADRIVLTFLQPDAYNPSSFNGYRFTDLTKPFTSATFDTSSTATGFNASNLLLANGSIFLNEAGVTIEPAQTVIIDVSTSISPVPEPTSIALIALPVALVGCYRRHIDVVGRDNF